MSAAHMGQGTAEGVAGRPTVAASCVRRTWLVASPFVSGATPPPSPAPLRWRAVLPLRWRAVFGGAGTRSAWLRGPPCSVSRLARLSSAQPPRDGRYEPLSPPHARRCTRSAAGAGSTCLRGEPSTTELGPETSRCGSARPLPVDVETGWSQDMAAHKPLRGSDTGKAVHR